MKFFKNIGLGYWLLLAALFWMLYLLQETFEIQEGMINMDQYASQFTGNSSILPSAQGNIIPIPSSSFSSVS